MSACGYDCDEILGLGKECGGSRVACSICYTRDRLARGIKDFRYQKISVCSPASSCPLRAKLVVLERRLPQSQGMLGE